MSGAGNWQSDPLADLDCDRALPFRISPGFVAFVAALVLPLVLALAVYAGAAAVASEVYAARADSFARESGGSSFNVELPHGDGVAGWKKALVGVCPVH